MDAVLFVVLSVTRPCRKARLYTPLVSVNAAVGAPSAASSFEK